MSRVLRYPRAMHPLTRLGALATLLLAGITVAACGSRSSRGQGSQPPGAYGPGPSGGATQTGPYEANQLPAPVRGTLDQYVQILSSSGSLEECAQRFSQIAGGGLVNEDGRSLRATIAPYSLKKDHQNIRFYARPLQITRVQVRPDQSDGYGASAIRGTENKIWIAKAQGQAGMPAPISIMVPENHPFVRGPRVVGIGSL